MIIAASVFGEQVKLGPMAPETKARWRKEMDWLLSVTDHIVELVPSQQKTKNGTNMEVTYNSQIFELVLPFHYMNSQQLVSNLDRLWSRDKGVICL